MVARVSGFVPTGADIQMIAGKDTGIGASGRAVFAQLYREASSFCAQQGKVMQKVKSESRGPRVCALCECPS